MWKCSMNVLKKNQTKINRTLKMNSEEKGGRNDQTPSFAVQLTSDFYSLSVLSCSPFLAMPGFSPAPTAQLVCAFTESVSSHFTSLISTYFSGFNL